MRVIARLDRATQYSAAGVVCTNRQRGLLDAPLEAGHDKRVCLDCIYRDTCADTASHFPFCLAQQSV
jgi:hypothetical protein